MASAVNGRSRAMPFVIGCVALVCALLLVSTYTHAPRSERALPEISHLPAVSQVVRYTGFVLVPKASVDSEGQVWLTAFVFRPSRTNHLVDAPVAALRVQCGYAPADYAALFRSLDSLLTFTASAGPDGNLDLASCPQDAHGSGNVDVGA